MKSVFCILMVFVSWSLSAQSIQINVIDAITKAPVPYANVGLYLLKSDAKELVNANQTDEYGTTKIRLDNKNVGQFIEITNLQYQPNKIPKVNEIRNDTVMIILLQPSEGITLNEVKIEGEKAVFTQSIDKKIINVDQLNANKNGTLFDILSNIPSISIDQDGSISMRGSQQINILIDGKPRSISAAALQQMPAATIESIELITNPSSKYDAEGTAGIINIVTKRNDRIGLNGTATIGASTGDKYISSFTFNHQLKRISYFINGNYRYDVRYRNGYGSRGLTVNESYRELYIDTKGEELTQNAGVRAGFDFSITPKHVVFFNGGRSHNPQQGLENMIYENRLEGVRTTQYRDESNTSLENNYDLEVGYKWTIKKPKHYLIVDVLKSNFIKEVATYYDLTDAQTQAQLISSTINNKQTNDILNYQIDYTMPFKTDGSIELGAKLTTRKFSISNGQTLTQSTLFKDYNYVFLFNDNIAAAYATFANKFKSKWGYKVGVRVENTNYNFNVATANSIEKNTKSFINFFPSMFATFAPNKTWNHQVGYSKRINRPSAGTLNPYQDINDPYSLRRGNPNLKPELIHSFEVNSTCYIKVGSISSSFYYRQTNNAFVRVVTIDSNNVLTVQMKNGNINQNAGVDLNSSIKPTAAWTINCGIGTYYNKVIADLFVNEAVVLKANVGNSFKVFATSDFQLNFRYSSPFVTPQGRVFGFNAIDISWKQKMLKNKLVLVMSVNDILDQQMFFVKGQDPTIKYEFMRKRESRVANITLTYNFGSNNENTKPNRRKQIEIPGSGGDSAF